MIFSHQKTKQILLLYNEWHTPDPVLIMARNSYKSDNAKMLIHNLSSSKKLTFFHDGRKLADQQLMTLLDILHMLGCAITVQLYEILAEKHKHGRKCAPR